jgi:prepilin-type processing-associated H-X9-DG protein
VIPARAAGEFLFSLRQFDPLANDLVSPRLLTCPADTRLPADSFRSLNNSNLSYLAGLRADYSRPNSLLAADRNLTNDLAGAAAPASLQETRGWRWTSELHQYKGNLLFSDGHVEEKTSQALASSLGLVQNAGGLTPPSVRGITAASPDSSRPSLPPSGGLTGRAENTLASSALDRTPNPQSSSLAPHQGQLAVSTAVSRPGAFSASSSDGQTITNAKSEITPTRVTEGPATKPGSGEDPGFSFFPPWFGATILDLLKDSLWAFYLAMLLIAGIALFLRLQQGSRKRRATNLRRGH